MDPRNVTHGLRESVCIVLPLNGTDAPQGFRSVFIVLSWPEVHFVMSQFCSSILPGRSRLSVCVPIHPKCVSITPSDYVQDGSRATRLYKTVRHFIHTGNHGNDSDTPRFRWFGLGERIPLLCVVAKRRQRTKSAWESSFSQSSALYTMSKKGLREQKELLFGSRVPSEAHLERITRGRQFESRVYSLWSLSYTRANESALGQKIK